MADRDMLDALVLLYLEDLIEQNFFFVLVKECQETAPLFPYRKNDRFESVAEDECLLEF